MRAFLLSTLALLAACAGPKPCTRTLCVAKLDGTLELSGWSGVIRESNESPKPPVVSNSTVTMLDGVAVFVNGKTRITAMEGASFKFTISTRAIPSIEVSSGAVAVATSSGIAVSLPPGSSYSLPKL